MTQNVENLQQTATLLFKNLNLGLGLSISKSENNLDSYYIIVGLYRTLRPVHLAADFTDLLYNYRQSIAILT